VKRLFGGQQSTQMGKKKKIATEAQGLMSISISYWAVRKALQSLSKL
jgi:hypothetical protein